MEKITTDICIIGAGPVGLFAVFEAGLLKMRCHLIDVLPQVGGQLSEIYPHKPIYDIPGYPDVTAQQLVDNLMLQIAPFHPTFSLGERVENLQRNDDGSYNIITNDGTTVHCQVVVIAGGLGCFEPRKPEIDRLTDFEGKGVAYMVKNPEHFRDKKVVLAGGGDSALDWAVFLSNVAERVTLVHRGDTFRGAPDSAEKVFELAREGKIDLVLKSNVVALTGDDRLQEVTLLDRDQQVSHIEADHLIPLFGLSPKLGPIADWGLNIDRSAIAVNTVDYSTNIERIYAIGDINTYPGKLKLILCGFHESALMAQSAFKYVYPEQKLSFKYTTVYGVSAF
ncbi:NAD(P)/FAD-dependent oxidoreductase [Mucilaginibacter rubeus]|uniref:Ferredoxin--NADP reductase n=1 Tax=Mucilaginibacter rubeus TaxID=2027860 RepID=A0AAE6JLK1_9SPHI|nr:MULTISPECIES: NAD(P)/FAD-dependent oxidoreductase [Mucilaginibacter]QEM07558.1 NAD(P)/FAD-dependent oxidoreductase [Mucilaginibacter rubeus]QEM20012.1 NAD(P)/FAD-dependent oxidoreductase [Mucilaginibacter gossypii]QTE43278.1 NAD(P)/FAD-dependent oxidoreductase [Mucilaginibacter rubeus]QTE49878.1 NAD(P)/FAD-dependent oxidoreductase [Mucilaginibacter rubeus]QTE54969.1 NAD(P)/FAD-dependent oxidoreductase [Mucilaginibacter rubeus]